MLLDHVISKPPTVGAYASHQMVSGLTEGEPALFCDLGDRILVRTEKPVTPYGKPLPEITEGNIRAFELRAYCGKKVRGDHRYFDLGDWRSRHQWLRSRSNALGFEVLTVNCTDRRLAVKKAGRRFHIDQTDFTGVLRITNCDLFRGALAHGVGSVGKAFGHSMLII